LLRLSNAIGRFEVEAAGDTLSVHLSRIINPCLRSGILVDSRNTANPPKASSKQGEMCLIWTLLLESRVTILEMFCQI